MDVVGLEGDLAVPQISFLPTHKIPPSGRPPGPLSASSAGPAFCLSPRRSGSPPLNRAPSL